MSFLLTLDDTKLEEIIPLLEKYKKKIDAAESIFKLEGRRLEEIMRTLPHYQSSYDQLYQEVKALEDWITNIKEKQFAKFWRKYNEGYSRALTARDITAYIGGEKEMVELNEILIEVVLLKNNLNSIVDALKQVGWMMSNCTKLRIAELQEAIL